MDTRTHHPSTVAPTARTDRRRFLIAGVGLALAGGDVGSAAAGARTASAQDRRVQTPAMLTFSDVCAVY